MEKDVPDFLICVGVSLSTALGVIFSFDSNFLKRVKIVVAAFSESCCPIIVSHKSEKRSEDRVGGKTPNFFNNS